MKKDDKFIRLIEGDKKQVIRFTGRRRIEYQFEGYYKGKKVSFWKARTEIKDLDYKKLPVT